jgi:hypothetical protein
MTRHLLLPVVGLILGLAAAPAQATLLVRSDGTGLLVQDKNGLSDRVTVAAEILEGRTAYRIKNDNLADFFRYDTQAGCREADQFDATCDRNGPQMNVVLVGGNDILDLRPAPAGQSSVAAGPGNDGVEGNPGRDQVHGGTGEDRVKGNGGNDTLDGEENADHLEGGSGNDTLEGEGSSDALFGDRGDDVLRGGAGNDFIESREPEGSTAVDDGVDCGNGLDRVDADLEDSVQADCEEVDEGAVGETPNVILPAKALRVSRTGRARVRLRCPRGVRSLGCKGRLQLRVGGSRSSRSRKVRYKIRAGRRKTVTLKLTRRDVRSIRRRGRRARGILTSVEKGRKGPKTTRRNPRLRLR